MIQRLPSIFAAVALAAGSCAIAQASIWHVSVVNDTKTCAIVAVSERIGSGAYVLLAGQGARQVHPHSEFEVPTSGGKHVEVNAVRVRAEMKAHPDCTGATVAEVDQIEYMTRLSPEFTEAAIFNTKVGYRIRFLAK